MLIAFQQNNLGNDTIPYETLPLFMKVWRHVQRCDHSQDAVKRSRHFLKVGQMSSTTGIKRRGRAFALLQLINGQMAKICCCQVVKAIFWLSNILIIVAAVDRALTLIGVPLPCMPWIVVTVSIPPGLGPVCAKTTGSPYICFTRKNCTLYYTWGR